MDRIPALDLRRLDTDADAFVAEPGAASAGSASAASSTMAFPTG